MRALRLQWSWAFCLVCEVALNVQTVQYWTKGDGLQRQEALTDAACEVASVYLIPHHDLQPQQYHPQQ